MCDVAFVPQGYFGCDLGSTSSVPSLFDRCSCGALLRTRQEE